jgi:hypothetical protein
LRIATTGQIEKWFFLNGFSTAACFAVASSSLLPPDKAGLDACLQSLNQNQQEVFKEIQGWLQATLLLLN